MPDLMATTEIVWVRANGDRTTLVAGVGVPFKADRCWHCPVVLHGLHEILPAMVGEDSLQSLCLALKLIQARLKNLLDDGDRLIFPGSDDDFPIHAYFGAFRV